MDYQALKTLIETHPTHASTSDEDMALWLNDQTAVTRDKVSIPSPDIFAECLNQIGEWNALTADERQIVRDILTIYENVPTQAGKPARTQLVAVLGTATKQAIAALIPENVSRATDAGFSRITAGDVIYARTL